LHEGPRAGRGDRQTAWPDAPRLLQALAGQVVLLLVQSPERGRLSRRLFGRAQPRRPGGSGRRAGAAHPVVLAVLRRPRTESRVPSGSAGLPARLPAAGALRAEDRGGGAGRPRALRAPAHRAPGLPQATAAPRGPGLPRHARARASFGVRARRGGGGLSRVAVAYGPSV